MKGIFEPGKGDWKENGLGKKIEYDVMN